MNWNENRSRMVVGTLLGLALISGAAPYPESLSVEAYRSCQPSRPVSGIFGDKLEARRIEQGSLDQTPCLRHVVAAPPYRPVTTATSQIEQSISRVGPRVGPRGYRPR